MPCPASQAAEHSGKPIEPDGLVEDSELDWSR